MFFIWEGNYVQWQLLFQHEFLCTQMYFPGKSCLCCCRWQMNWNSVFEKFLWIFLILYCFGSMRILTISAAETRWKAVIMNYTEQLTGTIESKGTGDLLCQSYLQHCNQFGNILSVFIWLLQLHTSKNTCRMMPPHSKLIQSRLYIFSN